jgi:hypothetical protein
MIIKFTHVLPSGVDQAVCLVWLAFLQTQWCSPYCFHRKEWELRFTGSESWRNCGNWVMTVVEQLNLLTR